METIKNKRLWSLLIACLLLVGMLVPIAGNAATQVTIETAVGQAEKWSRYNEGTWEPINSPWHYIVNGSGTTDHVGYCLQHKLPPPHSDDSYTAFDPSSMFSEHTIAGLQIIMELGYPVQYPFGTVSTEEAHYATSNAIRLWLSEETGGPNEYSYGYTNLSGVDLDAAYNSCKVEGKIDATASESTKRSFRAALKLLQAARSQSAPVHDITISPASIEMERDGDYYVGKAYIELEGVDNFTLDMDVLPAGTVVLDSNGNQITSGTKSMEVTVKVPRAGNAAKDVRLVAYGIIDNFPGNLLWVTNDRSSSQDILYWANETKGQTEASANMSTPRYGWLEVKKQDAETGDTAQGDASLEGMVVEIIANEDIPEEGFKKGDVVQTLDLTGKTSAKSKALYEASYIIRETGVPTGYLLNMEAHGVTVVADETQQVVVKDTVIKAPVSIVKFVDEPLKGEADNPQIKEPENGAKFEVTLKSSGEVYDTIETDENGYAETKPLPYGTYIFTQVAGKEGYKFVDPFEVVIHENSPTDPIPYIIENTVIHNIVRIIKVDAESGLPIVQEGVQFKIKDLETGEWVKQKMLYPEPVEIDVFETTADGRLTLPEPLRYGKYELHEISSPYPYLLLEEPVQFEISDKEVTKIEIVVENEIAKGQIDIKKTGEMFVGVEEEELEDGTIVKHPVFEERPLAGVELEIVAAEQIVSGDGVVHAEAGEVVQTIVTGSGQSNLSDELYLGKYIVREKSTVDGFLLDRTEYPVELKYEDNKTAVVMETVSIKNERDDIAVEVLKEKEVFHDGEYSYEPGAGFGFALVANEDLYGVDDNETPLIKAGDVVSVAVTDEDGKGMFTDDVPYSKNYAVKELYAPSNEFEVSEEEYPVDLSFKQDTPVIKVTVNNGETVKNDLVKVPVQISKTDITGEISLPGVTIEIYDEEGALIYTGVTQEDGKTEELELPVNRKYSYKEVKSVDGYALNTHIMQFEITEDGEIIGDMTIKDEVAKIVLLKLDANTKEPLEGVKFGLYDEAGNLVMEAVSQEDGLVIFEKVGFGKYQIKEISTVEGYQLSGEVITVEVNDTYENPAAPIEVLNFPIVQTGVEDFPWLAVGIGCGCVAAVLFVAGIIQKKRKK